MAPRKIITNLVGFVGSVALGWGVHGLTLIGGCGRSQYFDHACPPGSVPYFVAFFAGLVVTIGAFRAGGRLSLVFLFLGATGGSIWAGTELPPDDRAGPMVAAGLLIVAVFLPIVLIAVSMWRNRWKAGLIAHGSTAIGTVVDVLDTGATINDNPHVTLTLRIEPLDGTPAFDGEKSIIVSRAELPYVGQRFPVWFNASDHSKWVMVMKVNARSSAKVHELYDLAAAADPGRPGTAATT